MEHSWTCPDCGRQVPNRVETCRCGQARAPAPALSAAAKSAPAEEGPTVETSPALPRLLWLAGILLIVLAFWAGYSSRPAGSGAGDPARRATAPSGTRQAPARPPRAATDAAEPDLSNATSAEGTAPPAVPRAVPNSAAPPPAPVPASSPPNSIEDVAQRATYAVVRVESGTTLGSGFFVAPDTLLTNAHVVSDAWSVQIRRADGRTAPARVVASSPDTDIAVLKVANPDAAQVVLPMGSITRARSGQEVLAVGSPLGVFQNSVTRGIVSAVRAVGGVTFVQTDAAINPGNSGGPILTRDGDVIAIATMQVTARQGLNFGVGIDHARALLAGGQPVPAGGGTPVSNLDSALRDRDAFSADAVRDEAAREYERAMAQAAKSADVLDREWARFRSVCYQGRITGSFDREWFAIYEAQAMRDPMSVGCENYRSQLCDMAEELRAFMAARDEAARRAGVYPGVQRSIRSQLRLEYTGWTR